MMNGKVFAIFDRHFPTILTGEMCKYNNQF